MSGATAQPARDVRRQASVRVFKNYSFLAGCYAASRLLAFFSLVYLAQRLGVQAFGQVNFALAIFLYSTLLTHLGLVTFGTREVARHPGQIQGLVGRILALRGALTLASFLLLLTFTYLAALDSEVKRLIILFAFSLFPTAALLDWAFKGVERMNVAGIVEIVRAVPYLILILHWVRQPSEILRVPIFFFFSTLLAAVFGWALFRRDYGPSPPQVDLIFWKRAMRESLPLGFASMLLQVYYLTDTVVLGFLKGPLYVGWYSAAYKSVAFVLVLGALFFETTFPVLSRHYSKASERLPFLLNSSLRVTLLMAIPMAVGGTILAGPLLSGLYGPEYRAATIAFQLLIWAVAIELIGQNWGYALMACDRAKEYMGAMGWGAGLSVVLNLALIPRLGLMGAGLARLASSSLISVCLCYQFRRVIRLDWAQYLLKPMLASALMAAVLVLVGHSWILRLGLGIAVYGSTIFLIAPPERGEILKIAGALWTPFTSRLNPLTSLPGAGFKASENPLPGEAAERKRR